jgi:hypothetical protein
VSAEDLYSKVKNLYGDGNDIDEEKARHIIEYADDAIKEFGNTNQQKKVQLRKWKAQAEAVLPPGTIEELRKRAEGELLKRTFPRNVTLRASLLSLVILLVLISGILAIKKGVSEQVGTANAIPSPSPEQIGAKLSCNIDKLTIGEIPGTKFPQVFVQLSVPNAGTPSLAGNYRLYIKGEGLDVKDIKNTGAADEYMLTLADKSAKVPFRRQDSLAEKTIEPVKQGAKAEGWLRFNIEIEGVPPTFFSRPGIHYTVSLDDVAGKTCSADYTTREHTK